MSIPTYGNYINGEWITSGPTFENRNPANADEVVGLFVKGSAADVVKADEAAQAAFASWSTLAGPARGNYLFKVADILDAKFDAIAADMTREEGKTLPEAKGEVRRAINIFRYFGGEGSRMPGMIVPSERDRVHMLGSGVTVCHNLLAMEAAGRSARGLFAPSWRGWIRDLTHAVVRV